jgi:hypothetical protein
MLDTRYLLMAAALLATAFAPALSFAQTDGEVTATYSSSYEVETPDVTRPVTLGLEYHLYSPGEQVMVTGSVWSEILENVENLNVINVELKDGNGNVIDRQEASVEGDGSYTAILQILENTSTGTYTVESRVELEADALGIIEAIAAATLMASHEFVVAERASYTVEAEEQSFEVIIASNSEVDNFVFDQEGMKIAFSVEGEDFTRGVAEITIPKVLLSGDMHVFIDGSLMAEEDVIVKSETESETVFEINYDHSVHEVEVTGTNVIPEFPVVAVITAAALSVIVGISVARTRGYFGGLWGN